MSGFRRVATGFTNARIFIYLKCIQAFRLSTEWTQAKAAFTHLLTLSVWATDDRLYKSSAVAEMGDRLATVDMGQQWVLLCRFMGPHLTQCPLGREKPLYQVAS